MVRENLPTMTIFVRTSLTLTIVGRLGARWNMMMLTVVASMTFSLSYIVQVMFRGMRCSVRDRKQNDVRQYSVTTMAGSGWANRRDSTRNEAVTILRMTVTTRMVQVTVMALFFSCCG